MKLRTEQYDIIIIKCRQKIFPGSEKTPEHLFCVMIVFNPLLTMFAAVKVQYSVLVTVALYNIH